MRGRQSQQSSSGEWLDRHDRLLGLLDDAKHPVRLDLHQKASSVEDLDVALNIGVLAVGIDHGLRHVCRETGDHVVLADQPGIAVEVANNAGGLSIKASVTH